MMSTIKSILLSALLIAVTHAQLDMTSDKKMEYEDNIAEESQSSEQRVFTDVLAPKPILNDGKPFYVARDPTTGTLDFNSKKTVGIQNDIPISRKDEISVNTASKGHDINSIGHTFHDYLNIPVKYSSSKFVYPLISSSYANLKYQGNNKNQVSNHKNYSSTLGTTTNSPKYFTHIITSKSATEYTTPAPRITTRRVFTTSFTTEKATERATTRTTTQSPTTTPTSTTTTTTTQRPTVPSTEATSTVKYSSTIIQSSQFPSTFKKYVDSSETRKKYTTEKPHDETTMPANPVKFLDDLLDAIERKETTTLPPPPPTTHRSNILSFSTSMPLRPSGFKPMPTEPPRDHSQKITFEKAPTDPGAMSLSEIFNSIAGNDNFSNERNEVVYQGADSSKIEIKKPLPLSTMATSITRATQPPMAAPVQHKTLQQQMKDPQYIDLPVHQPPQLIAGSPQGGGSFSAQQHSSQYGGSSSHVGFPDDQFEDYVEFESPSDEYVRYEVQKPNVNMVKFGQQMPVPSINNVVISPGQNSATFVLGSQQSVGSIGVGSSMGVGTSHFVDNSSNRPVKMGQVINDEPPVRPNNIQASIRFPTDAESAFDNAPIIKGTIKIDGSVENVHPPQALLQNQPAASQISVVTQNPLVFPSNNAHVMQAELSVGMAAPTHHQQQQSQPPNPSQVIFENVNDIYEKVNGKKQKQEVKEVSSNDLPPPSVLTPPSPTQLNQFNRLPQYGPQRRPQKPNILPQFRPNSRLSQGHPLYRQEVGAIRVPNIQQYKPFMPQQAIPKVGLPPMNPNMRRIPQQMPQQYPQQYRPQYTESANRRVFKVPPPGSQQFPLADRFMKPPPMQQPPLYYLNRPLTATLPETMQMQQRPSIIPYQDVELNKSYPPTPAINISSRNDNEDGSGKLEPVVTLQMLHAKKNGNKLNIPSVAVPHEIPQDISLLPKNHKNDLSPSKEPSVYVVYPISGNDQNSVAQEDEKREEQLPIPSTNEYQNTPFTVVSHFEQEPLLMKKDKKKPQFPYQIEKPMPPLVEKIPLNFNSPHGHSIYNIGEEPHDPISSKLTRITEKPIAIAYTPTEPSRIAPPMSYYQHYQPQHLYSSPNFASPVISEIVDEKHGGYDFDYYHRQQQVHGGYQGSSEEVSEFHKQHYDFEAPFHASVSLTPEVTNPYQGWSIVTKATEINHSNNNNINSNNNHNVNINNKIDRADLNVVDSSEEGSTIKYDPEEFQPIFETGFQPIYSSNRVSTAPELIQSNEESHELPSTMALSQTSPASSVPSTTTATPQKIASNEVKSSEESTTAKVVVTEKKPPQSMEIDSLEALFESLTRDYDDEEEASSSNKSENESRSL